MVVSTAYIIIYAFVVSVLSGFIESLPFTFYVDGAPQLVLYFSLFWLIYRLKAAETNNATLLETIREQAEEVCP